MYRVYLVDDEKLILEELVEMVPWLDNGFEVAGSNNNPLKAIEEIKKLRPDTIFTDLKMPVMDGIELVRKLKSEGIEAEFIMLSAYNDFESVRSFFQESGFDYILKPVNNEEIEIVLERLTAKLSKIKPQYAPEDSGDALTDNPNFNRLILYINEHFAEKITLESLSRDFGFSKNYICRLFQKNVNKSLNLYLTDIRLENAQKLLKDKTVLIKEVASRSGYPDYYHFSRVFKEKYGLSPKEMRERN